jgi:hypothetical protein
MIRRANSWNPNEEQRITLNGQGSSEAYVYDSGFGRVVNVRKSQSGYEYLYRNITDEVKDSALPIAQSFDVMG